MPFNREFSHQFEAQWDNVSYASWIKYPNPSRPDIISVDILNKKFDPEKGTLMATRLVFMKEKLPKLMASVFGPGYCICVEDSFVDAKNKKMILKSENVSYGNILSIKETCTYTQNNQDPNFTDYKQEIKCEAFPFGIAGTIEKFVGHKVTSNAEKGKLIMETAINKVKAEAEEIYQALLQKKADSTQHFTDSLKEHDDFLLNRNTFNNAAY